MTDNCMMKLINKVTTSSKVNYPVLLLDCTNTQQRGNKINNLLGNLFGRRFFFVFHFLYSIDIHDLEFSPNTKYVKDPCVKSKTHYSLHHC